MMFKVCIFAKPHTLLNCINLSPLNRNNRLCLRHIAIVSNKQNFWISRVVELNLFDWFWPALSSRYVLSCSQFPSSLYPYPYYYPTTAHNVLFVQKSARVQLRLPCVRCLLPVAPFAFAHSISTIYSWQYWSTAKSTHPILELIYICLLNNSIIIETVIIYIFDVCERNRDPVWW